MKQEELLKLVEHIEVPYEIIKQSEMLKKEYLPPYISRISEINAERALFLIKEFSLEEQFDLKEMVQWAIDGIKKRKKGGESPWDVLSVIYFIKDFNLKGEVDVKPLIQILINGELFDEAIYWIKKMGLEEDREWLKEKIQELIDDNYFDTALTFIYEFYLKDEFDIKELIEKLVEYNDFDNAFYWIKEFGLGDQSHWIKKLLKIISIVDDKEAERWIREFELE